MIVDVEEELKVSWKAHGLIAEVRPFAGISGWRGRRLSLAALGLTIAAGLIGASSLFGIALGLAMIGLALDVVPRIHLSLTVAATGRIPPVEIRGQRLILGSRAYDLTPGSIQVHRGGIEVAGSEVWIPMAGNTDRAKQWLAARLAVAADGSVPDPEDPEALARITALMDGITG